MDLTSMDLAGVTAVKRPQKLVAKRPVRLEHVSYREIEKYGGKAAVEVFRSKRLEVAAFWKKAYAGMTARAAGGGGKVFDVLRKWGLPDREPSTSSVRPQYLLEMSWYPWYESEEGSTLIISFVQALEAITSTEVHLRWRMLSMKSSSACMWKDATIKAGHVKFRGTKYEKDAEEDYCGVVETGT